MKEIWTEVIFIDMYVGESWSAFYIGNREEVKTALDEMLKDDVVIYEIGDSFEVER